MTNTLGHSLIGSQSGEFISLVHWSYVGFVAPSVLTEMLLFLLN